MEAANRCGADPATPAGAPGPGDGKSPCSAIPCEGDEAWKVIDGTYVMTVRGVAGPAVRAAFGDVELSVVGGTTVLRRAGTDRAALHGLLRRIQDLGLDIIDVHLKPPEPA